MAAGFRRSPGRRARATVAAALAATLALAGGAPVRPVVAGDLARPTPVAVANPPSATGTDPRDRPAIAEGTDAASPDLAGLQPSIQYEQAMAHAKDRIAFRPGGRVGIGFTPRASDRWPVGGLAPRSLPSGRLDGAAIRGQKTGPLKALGRPDPGIDLPTQPAIPTDATNASFAVDSGPTTDGTVSVDAAISPAGLRREIFGFLPYWEVSSSSLNIVYGRISTIAYFGIGADAAGNLQKRNSDGSATVGWSGWTSSRMTGIIDAAHSSHTRVVLTVQSFGWTSSSLARQKTLLTSSTARANLARQIAAAVGDRGADGVNLDFEPLASGGESGFVALVKSIRAELNKIHTGYQITFDALGSIGNYPIEAATAAGAADAIFVMGYDYRTSGSSPVGSVAPLVRSAGLDIRDTVAAYAARVAPSKVILGVPYYGRAWSTSSNTLNATNTSSTKTGASTAVVYDTAADYLAQHGRHYDPVEAVAWTAYTRQNCTSTYGCVTSWRQLYVDDAAALGSKYDLVNAYGLRGAGIWALGYDGSRPELWDMIKAKFITDTAAPVVGVRRLSSTQGNPAFAVSWTGTDDSGIGAWDVQASVDGGPWRDWLTGTTATSATYQGYDGHGYAFRVRARDIKGNVGAWNVTTTSATASTLAAGGFGRVLLDTVSVRSAAGTSASVVGTLSRGDVVAITSAPVSRDGYTWVRITGPLTEWSPIHPAFSGRWVPSSGGRIVATGAPNATTVDAVIGNVAYDDAGAASIGSSSTAVAHRAFSPNHDGRRDGIRLSWTNGRALDALALRVLRTDGTKLGDIPLGLLSAGSHALTWDGTVGGRALPDGGYLLTLIGRAGATTYFNPVTDLRATAVQRYGVTIDTIRPTIVGSSADGAVISPNGDGRFDTVHLSVTTSGGGVGWTLGIAPYAGSASVATRTFLSGAGGSPSITWNGTVDGSVPADGAYLVRLTIVDAAGNPVSRAWLIRVDRTSPVLRTTAPASFSPNGDGASDTAALRWSSSEAIRGTARIHHGSTVIRSWAIPASTSGTIAWDGRSSAGAAVPDGTYTLDVVGRDAAGNFASSTSTISVDRTIRGAHWTVGAFFPQDGDAIAASDAFGFTLTRPATVTVGIWSGSTLVRTIWSGRAMSAGGQTGTWDGRDGHGAFVPRGTYRLAVTATSAIGTSAVTAKVAADAFLTSLNAGQFAPGQTITLTFASTERLVALPTVTFSQPGRAGVKHTAAAVAGGRYRVRFVVAAGPAGVATLVIGGRDAAGGWNTTARTAAIR